VCESNTAIACGSGTVPVFATPAMIALMERTALSSVEPFLDDEMTTVGTLVNVRHLAATPLGMKVTAFSELQAIDGKRLVFNVEAKDETQVVGCGTHERYIVSRQKFLAKAACKKKG